MKKITLLATALLVIAAAVWAQPLTGKGGPGSNNFVQGECNGNGPHHNGFGRGERGQRDEWRKGGERGMFGPEMAEYLELTDEQIDKIDDIRKEYKKKDIDLNAESKKLRIDMQDAMKDMDFDKARKLTKKIGDNRTESRLMNIEEKEKISKVLTKEQVEKFKEHRPGEFRKQKMGKFQKQ